MRLTICALFATATIQTAGTAHATPFSFDNPAVIAIPDNSPTPTGSTIATPAGEWRLLIKDDSAGDVGAINAGWRVTLDVVAAQVADVNFSLFGFTHSFFPDLDFGILGPNNVFVALSTDNSGTVSNSTVVFDSQAATAITSATITAGGGTFRAEGGLLGINLPAGAASGASLAAFNGLPYVVAPVPEPATLILVACGLGGLVRLRRMVQAAAIRPIHERRQTRPGS